MSAKDLFPKAEGIYTTYRATIRFSHLVVGGVPSDRSVIEKWIRARVDDGDQAVAELIDKTVRERGVIQTQDAVNAVLDSELAPSINGFKRTEAGALALEGRQVKAALKEWGNSAFPGTKFPGKPADIRKGFMRFASETIMVPEVLIPLTYLDPETGEVENVTEPTEVEERVKHVMTPQGPRSSINRVEVVARPTIQCHFDVRDDFFPQEAWARVWQVGEAIGLGADRGRSDGKFTLEAWDKV